MGEMGETGPAGRFRVRKILPEKNHALPYYACALFDSQNESLIGTGADTNTISLNPEKLASVWA